MAKYHQNPTANVVVPAALVLTGLLALFYTFQGRKVTGHG